MITGSRILLRPIGDEDWPKFEEWGSSREVLWGPFTDGENKPAQRVMESVGFQREGVLRRARWTRKWQRTCWPG